MSRHCRASSRSLDRARVALAGFAFTLVAASANAQGVAVNTGAVTVSVDTAKVVRLPPATQTVVVGNPGIADVTIQKNGVLILTGKSYGATNLIALDASGSMLAETFIDVRAPEASATVTVMRATDRQSYSCTPACQPTVRLGDEAKYFTEISGQAGARNAFATPKDAASR